MKKIFTNKLIIGIVIALVYFLVLFWTLSDYGINWDEPQHFSRGQAYLHYFLTGKTNYFDLPKYPPFKGTSEFGNFRGADDDLRFRQQHPELTNKNFRRSFYQFDAWTADFYLQNDSGHPPLNDILAASTNYVFYQKLGILDDINAYHLFEILTGTLLLFLVFMFAAEYYGIFAGFIASLSLFLYPLFLGEVHFNIKDPPEAAFYGLTIYTFFKGVTKKSWGWLITSSFAFGFALGTKFNILFVPLILVPWLIVYLYPKIKKSKIISSLLSQKKMLLSFFLYPFIAFGIFFGTWPYLWQNPIHNILSIFGWYKDVGFGISYQPQHLLYGWNTYPAEWILYTTPPMILFLFFAGVIFSLFLFKKEKNKLSFLLILWLAVSILRVSIQNVSIYGGVRQIMEYIPAMVLLSGLGADAIRKLLIYVLIRMHFASKKYLSWLNYCSMFIILISFLPLTIILIHLHPNENLYFNFFIGGLSGAKEANIPSWGNSYGNVYLQGVKWINTYAEENARLSLISGTMINVPRIRLRSDIDFSNNYWSGTNRGGEYVMDMIYEGFPLKTYIYEYLKTYLKPVYEYKIDGVTVLEIWKNDKEHTKKGYINEDNNVTISSFKKEGNALTIVLEKEIFLTKLDLFYSTKNCSPLKEGFIQVSPDGKNWERQGENIPVYQYPMGVESTDKHFIYFFAAKPTGFLQINTGPKDSCLFNIGKISISKLSDMSL